MRTDTPSHATTIWRLDGTRALLESPALSAVVDVTTPSRGLADLTYRGNPVAGWLLGVTIDAIPDDAYARGSDLVVAYHESAERPFSVQVYWTVCGGGRDETPLVIDTTVSIQTRQWEAYPRVAVRSVLDGCDAVALDEEGVLWRPEGAAWTYAEVTPAHDFVRRAPADGAASAEPPSWTFSDEFMERGVIRRLRVRGALMPRAGDVDAALHLRAALLAEQPPLTA